MNEDPDFLLDFLLKEYARLQGPEYVQVAEPFVEFARRWLAKNKINATSPSDQGTVLHFEQGQSALLSPPKVKTVAKQQAGIAVTGPGTYSEDYLDRTTSKH